MNVVVHDEHTLGILNGDMLEVLGSLGSRGGRPFWNSPYFVIGNTRPATREDFDTFKVSFHQSYLTPAPDVVL